MLVQVAPGNTRPRNPENSIQNKAMIPGTPPAARTTLDHEGLKTGPFLVAHQSPDQDSLLKSNLESEPTPFGNPLCQHLLNLVANAYCFTGAPELGHLRALQAVNAAPNYGNAHYALAVASSMLNRFDQAIEQCHIAASLMPGAFSVYYVKIWHANALIRAGRWDEAEASYDEGLAIAPDFAIGQYHKAMFCWRDGRKPQGRRIVATLRAGGMDYATVRNIFERAFIGSPTFDEMMTDVEALWAETETAP